MNRKLVDGLETTKACPECGSKALVLLGTQDRKMCADCPTSIVWRLTGGQAGIHGGVTEELES